MLKAQRKANQEKNVQRKRERLEELKQQKAVKRTKKGLYNDDNEADEKVEAEEDI
jgi:hypothetical protein